MDDDTIRKLTGQAAFDQTYAGLAQLAAMYGTFYSGLLANNIPVPLAEDMVRDWFRFQIRKMLWPDAPLEDGE